MNDLSSKINAQVYELKIMDLQTKDKDNEMRLMILKQKEMEK